MVRPWYRIWWDFLSAGVTRHKNPLCALSSTCRVSSALGFHAERSSNACAGPPSHRYKTPRSFMLNSRRGGVRFPGSHRHSLVKHETFFPLTVAGAISQFLHALVGCGRRTSSCFQRSSAFLPPWFSEASRLLTCSGTATHEQRSSAKPLNRPSWSSHLAGAHERNAFGPPLWTSCQAGTRKAEGSAALPSGTAQNRAKGADPRTGNLKGEKCFCPVFCLLPVLACLCLVSPGSGSRVPRPCPFGFLFVLVPPHVSFYWPRASRSSSQREGRRVKRKGTDPRTGLFEVSLFTQYFFNLFSAMSRWCCTGLFSTVSMFLDFGSLHQKPRVGGTHGRVRRDGSDGWRSNSLSSPADRSVHRDRSFFLYIVTSSIVFWDFGSLYLVASRRPSCRCCGSGNLNKDVAASMLPTVAAAAHSALLTVRRHEASGSGSGISAMTFRRS